MASILPGYEYDIFISYRHNDNRSGWVTEFVKALQEELAATIKEPVSVYFDTDPHEGLLETHDVDDSLKGKLRCLLFIPVISQTYCDTKSFAWRKEFLSFKKLASEDHLGLKIKLQNGNVASRILPVRIHELEKPDLQLLEAELGVLRAVDFIYRSSGVARPLLAHEEDAKSNLDHTFYLDQINKVVRAAKGLIMAMQTPPAERMAEIKYTASVSPGRRMKLAWVAWGLLLLGIISFGIFYFGGITSGITLQQNSIAVLPFENLSNDPEQEYFCDGTTEQVISSLARLKDLKVIARTSVLQYKKTTKTIAQIGRELNVTHVLESSVRKSGSQIRVTAQLIAVKDESHLWAEDFDNKLVADIFQIQDAVATKIATSLKNQFLPVDKEKLRSEKPSNPEAYEHFLKGEYIHGNYYIVKFVEEDFLKAENEFKFAIQLDSNYATAHAALANLYDTRSNAAASREDRQKYRQMSIREAHKAYKLNPKLPYSLLVQFQTWWHRKNTGTEIDSAFKYGYLSYEAAPSSGLICSEFGVFNFEMGLFSNAQSLLKQAQKLNPAKAVRYVQLGVVDYYSGNRPGAQANFEKALSIEPKNIFGLYMMLFIYSDEKKWQEAEDVLGKLRKANPDRDFADGEAYLRASKGEKDKALSKYKDAGIYMILKMKKEALDEIEKNAPFVYLQFQDPRFDFLRGDPRFEKIVSKAKALYELRLKKYGQFNELNN